MGKSADETTEKTYPPVINSEAVIAHFREALASGKHWYLALLESIGLWTDETERLDGQDYRYLIDGEAFDWLLLAERLCDTVDGMIPEKEKSALLFKGKPPLELKSEEFKDLIGQGKYHQYLNFFYGVTVEEALVQAVREEVRKERASSGLSYRQIEESDTFVRIYGEPESALLKLFRKEKRRHLNISSNISEMKEFAYWRFKYRVRECEKAKVASDTHKALEWLKKNGASCLNYKAPAPD
jgi:hypothetical protein